MKSEYVRMKAFAPVIFKFLILKGVGNHFVRNMLDSLKMWLDVYYLPVVKTAYLD